MKKRNRQPVSKTVRPVDRQSLEPVAGGESDSEWKYVPIRRFYNG